ncbi:Hypothetical predicted protein [Octopus vulgaris]|uniref:Uncharacterized protein n=1 Tax=Octopus vulgaris TaxID=6645 RepID=A0AA36BHE5_OCTVU|nr:Hypothetical predicted protein [Octopus vulgaris]
MTETNYIYILIDICIYLYIYIYTHTYAHTFSQNPYFILLFVCVSVIIPLVNWVGLFMSLEVHQKRKSTRCEENKYWGSILTEFNKKETLLLLLLLLSPKVVNWQNAWQHSEFKFCHSLLGVNELNS